MASNPRQFRNIAGAATTVVLRGAGRLRGIIINQAVASSTITIYDNTSASGTIVGTITQPVTLLANQESLDYYSLQLSTGLTIVTSAADNITVVYS
jgi:hypothetical protein